VYTALQAARLLPGFNVYEQPSKNLVRLNADQSVWDRDAVHETTADFLSQMFWQHSMIHAYMPLLGAPPLPLDERATKGAPGDRRAVLAEPGRRHALTIDDAGIAEPSA
jgi:hypothetical protein